VPGEVVLMWCTRRIETA